MEPYDTAIAKACKPVTEMTKREFMATMIFTKSGDPVKAIQEADKLIKELSKTYPESE